MQRSNDEWEAITTELRADLARVTSQRDSLITAGQDAEDAILDMVQFIDRVMQPKSGTCRDFFRPKADSISIALSSMEYKESADDPEAANLVEELAAVRSQLDERTQHCIELMDEQTRLRKKLDAVMEALHDPQLLENLAAIEHHRWSGYRERCVAQVVRYGDAETHEERWRRQRETFYINLTEKEKESDRIEARKSLGAVIEYLEKVAK